MPNVELRLLDGEFAVCKLDSGSQIPVVPADSTFFSVTVTDREVSLVCPAESRPPDVQTETGWRALYAAGPMPFGLTGVIASLTGALAEGGQPVFVVSTFDGDVLMVRGDSLPDAIRLLEGAGHTVTR